jgi:uncharacterized membrane protein
LDVEHRNQPAFQTRARSIAKSVSWRLFGSIDTFVLSYIISHQVKVGAFIASSEVLTKLALYYLHERGWAHIRWGLHGRTLGERVAPTASGQTPNSTTPRGA